MSPRPLVLRAALLVLTVMLVLLQFKLWVSDDGFSEVLRLKEQVAFQAEENTRLAERNKRLDAEVDDLRQGFSALEERARSDLGLIAPKETFYIMGDDLSGESAE